MWQPLEELNRSKSQIVLVFEDGAIRLFFWNHLGKFFEHLHPVGTTVSPDDVGYYATHFMPCPDEPNIEDFSILVHGIST